MNYLMQFKKTAASGEITYVTVLDLYGVLYRNEPSFRLKLNEFGHGPVENTFLINDEQVRQYFPDIYKRIQADIK